jgi:hypothetical protein
MDFHAPDLEELPIELGFESESYADPPGDDEVLKVMSS